MYICIHINMCIHMCVYIYIYIYTHISFHKITYMLLSCGASQLRDLAATRRKVLRSVFEMLCLFLRPRPWQFEI